MRNVNQMGLMIVCSMRSKLCVRDVASRLLVGGGVDKCHSRCCELSAVDDGRVGFK